MDRLVAVSMKGPVVIPPRSERSTRLGRAVVVTADVGGRITIEPSQSMEESFGADGDAMLEVASEISKERRRREVEPEHP